MSGAFVASIKRRLHASMLDPYSEASVVTGRFPGVVWALWSRQRAESLSIQYTASLNDCLYHILVLLNLT